MDELLAGINTSVTSFHGVGIVVAAVMILLARLLLPKEDRRNVQVPLALLALHLAIVAIRVVLPADVGAHQPLALIALFLLLIAMGRAGFLLVMHSVVSRRIARPLPKIFRDLLQLTVYAAILMLTLRAAGVEPGSLLTTSALLTAVIGLSLQDTLGNLFSGLAIHAQRPFEVGDWIQFDNDPEHIGRVAEINWRAAKVLTIENVEITVPNNSLAKAPIHNYSRPTAVARRQVTIVAPYEVPPHQVVRHLTVAAGDVPGVVADPPPTVVPSEYTERGIEYAVRYYVRDFENRDVIAGMVRERLWYALERAHVRIPAPRRRVELHEVSEASRQRDHEQQLRARERALRCVDFLDVLPGELHRRLAELTELRIYDAGEHVIRQGQGREELFIVERGEVVVLLHPSDRHQVEIATLGPGKFFGEMSLMTGELRTATVRATDECELLVVGKAAFQQILQAAPEIAERISEVLAERQATLGDHAVTEADRVDGPIEDRSGVILSRIKEFFSI